MQFPRRTIASTADISGVGVFSGNVAPVRFLPTTEPAGIVFSVGGKRISLGLSNIIDLQNRTAVESDGARVEVVEHLLACLHIAGITDLLIECPAGEIPLLDGSAEPIWQVIEAAGIKEINGDIDPIVATKPEYVERDEAVLICLPSDEFRISYFLAYDDPRIGCEEVSLVIDREQFAREIAPARSFIEYEEVQKLVDAGIVKSTDTSLALIIYQDGSRSEFRVEKEFAKHKMLDLIGDLYLAGRPVIGHFIGLRSGHGLNREMIRKLANS